MGAALNMIYNHYLASYNSRRLTRFDAHKRSELRNVYNSMVKINRDAPWYLPASPQAQQYAVELKESARNLHNTIACLGGLEENGLFDQKSAYSSDPEFVSASYAGPHSPKETVPEFDVEVFSLASPQKNQGLFLEDTKVSLAPGSYSIDIGIGEMSYEFQFALDGTETNGQLQERLARLINSSAVGIRASLAQSDSRTSLQLVSETTGVPSGRPRIFQVSDDHTSKMLGTVAYLGLNNMVGEASDATISVNGSRKSSSSNQMTLEGFFDILLKKVTPIEKPVHIGLKTDTESLTDNITQLMDGYNAFIRAVSSLQSAQTKSLQLMHELEDIASDYSSLMEPAGLSLTDDGTVSVERELLHQTAARTQDAAQTFGFIKNFCNRLMRKSSQISLNPMKYVEKKVVAYKNPGHSFVSPYSPGSYSGMMFNGYC